jgi:tetratricopeptide (TPR) repeat protein
LRPITAALLESENREDLQRILLAVDTIHKLAYFDALARHFASLDAVDANKLPRRVRARFWQLAESADDDVAALALATLHVDGGRNARTRAALADRLRTLGSRHLSVRRRWAIALGHRADTYRKRGRGSEALALYGKALELLPDDPAFLLAFAQARLDAGDSASATELLRRLIGLDSLNSLVWINYGLARTAAGDPKGALGAFRQATIVNPYDGLAHFHLGNAFIGEGRRAEAAAAYRRALELDPALAPAHFNLARLLLLEGQNQQALSALRAGLVFDPTHRDAREVADRLEGSSRDRGGQR